MVTKDQYLRVRVSSDMLQGIDHLAQQTGGTRSTIVRRVLEAEIWKWTGDPQRVKEKPPGRGPQAADIDDGRGQR